MTRILLYEFITGGGTLTWPNCEAPTGSLLTEGTAMLRALCRDVSMIEGVWPHVFWDARLPPPSFTNGVDGQPEVVTVTDRRQHDRRLAEMLDACDEALIVAPELFGTLLALTQTAESHGVRMLSPASGFVAVASSKFATIRRLKTAGVPVPTTVRCRAPWDLPVDVSSADWILKPDDGAGSDGIVRTSIAHFEGGQLDWRRVWCAQRFQVGRPASVAALCAQSGPFELLPPTWQTLDANSFAYLGGQMMTDPAFTFRAQHLARQALEAMPPARGFVGVDLVLSARPEDDVVIEVNPRLTTSYVGLSQACRGNLAAAMRDRILGQKTELSFTHDPLEFDSNGTLRTRPE